MFRKFECMSAVRLPRSSVIVEIFCGLGNQMFQYAAGRALAMRHDAPLYISQTHLRQDPLRQYQLHVFNIQAQLLTDEQQNHCRDIVGERHRGKRALRKAMRRVMPGLFLKHFQDRDFAWRPEFESLQPMCYLEGYWQDERYFLPIRQTLLKDLAIKEPATGRNLELSQEISQCTAVSLHVRRGDYLRPDTASHMAHCTLDYYRKAIEHVTCRCENPVFYVFSDDIPWVREHLPIHEPVVFVDHNDGSTAHWDMRLMSLCRHNIIANSSFSWWGAWLNAHANKIVCYPGQWYNDPRRNELHLRSQPATWVRL